MNGFGYFKFAGALNMKVKQKPSAPQRPGINPTKKLCVFKARPASKTVQIKALKKLKEMIS